MKTKTFSVCLALITGLASVRADETPKWLVEAKLREARLPALVQVASEDGWFKTQAPGKVRGKVLKEEGSYSLDIEISKGVTVSCEVIPEPRDLAAFMREVVEISFKRLAEANGTVEARVLEASDAGVAGPHAFLSLRWLYRANRKGELRVGGLKQYIAAVDQAVVYCANDDLGYVKSFDAVAKAMTVHMQTPGAALAPQAYFREVNVASVDGARVGVVVTSMTRDADGDTEVLNQSAMLLEAAPGQLVAQDVSVIEWVRPDGSLINAIHVSQNNGEVGEDMTLKREAGIWRASGTLRGKPFNAEIPEAPSSYVQQARTRRGLMAQAQPVGALAEANIWSALDLTRLLPSRVTLLAPVGDTAFTVREEIGGIALDAVLDRRTGTLQSAKMPIGPRVLHFERVHHQGEF
jgi:hypothetical protein